MDEVEAYEVLREQRRQAARDRCQAKCAALAARGLVTNGDVEMARALRILGLEAHTVTMDTNGATVCYTTPEGAATAEALRSARRLVTTSIAGVARRFAGRPDVLAEFRAAHALDADRETLGAIFAPLLKRAWARRLAAKANKKPKRRAPSAAVREMRRKGHMLRKRRR